MDPLRQAGDFSGDLEPHLTADADIDLIKDQCLLREQVRDHHLNGERNTGDLPAGCRIAHAAERLTRVRREIKFHLLCAIGHRALLGDEVELHPRIFHAHILQRHDDPCEDFLRGDHAIPIQHLCLLHQETGQ